MAITHIPRWFIDEQPATQIDVLTPAIEDVGVAIRLANDLATFSWEQTQPGQNNILMYDTTPDRVRAELTRRADSARRRLAPLVARDFGPAVELIRNLEWAIEFYALVDFRGWGSDVPATTTPDTRSNIGP